MRVKYPLWVGKCVCVCVWWPLPLTFWRQNYGAFRIDSILRRFTVCDTCVRDLRTCSCSTWPASDVNCEQCSLRNGWNCEPQTSCTHFNAKNKWKRRLLYSLQEFKKQKFNKNGTFLAFLSCFLACLLFNFECDTSLVYHVMARKVWRLLHHQVLKHWCYHSKTKVLNFPGVFKRLAAADLERPPAEADPVAREDLQSASPLLLGQRQQQQ